MAIENYTSHLQILAALEFDICYLQNTVWECSGVLQAALFEIKMRLPGEWFFLENKAVRQLFLFITTGLVHFFLARLVALSWEDRVSKHCCVNKQKHKQVKKRVQLVRKLQCRKRSRKNEWWDKGANTILKGEVEHVMLHDITSEFIPELPVQSGPNVKDVLQHSPFPVITSTTSSVWTFDEHS